MNNALSDYFVWNKTLMKTRLLLDYDFSKLQEAAAI